MRLQHFCQPFQWGILFHVLLQWRRSFRDEYDFMSQFLLPTDELATDYPGKDVPWDTGYRIVIHKNGTIVGIDDEDCTNRLTLTKADIIQYRFDLKRFRRETCECLGLKPDSGDIKPLDRVIPWGVWEPEKGTAFPVTLLLHCFYDRFKETILERVLNRATTGEIILTPTRNHWKDGLDELARKNNLLFVPLDEILQLEDGKLLPTPEWDEYLTAFCKMVEMDLPSQLRSKPQGNLFAKRGEWVFRFSGRDITLNGNLQGPAFIRRLMMTPNQEIHVEQLWKEVFGTGDGNFAQIESGAEGEWDSFLSSGDDMLDDAGKSDYQKRLLQLHWDRAEAESVNDTAWLERIDAETGAISDQLLKTVDGKGRPRKVGNERDRLRKRISNNITKAIGLIARTHSELADHLKKSVEMGEYMVYRPSEVSQWSFE